MTAGVDSGWCGFLEVLRALELLAWLRWPQALEVVMSQEQLANLQLIHKIASGGMGEVWEARRTGPRDFKKRLAVKKILPHLTEDEEFVNMFLDEGWLVAQLDHPNICQIYRLGQSDGVYYMEMEYIEGTVLTQIIDKASRRGDYIPFEHCCQIAIGICAGLDYAHSRTDEHGVSLGIIHRDVSPPNLMLSSEGYVKILDFGIAKARSRIQHTQPGLLKGKLGYVSPEQVHGQEIDARSDLFCVGIVLWEMLTNRRLFYAKDEMATLRMISLGQYASPASFRNSLPPELEWIVMKALAPRREDRFQSCGEMQQALEDYLYHSGLLGGFRRLATFVRRLMDDLPLGTEGNAEASGGSSHLAAKTRTSLVVDTPSGQELPVEKNKPARHRILITDDEKDILDAVEMILTSGGYEVDRANDGLEAVEKIQEKQFDVCMLDLDMPRLDGRGALEKIRQIQPSLPCIIQTGNDSFHMATEMGRRGAVTYLLKPARRKAVLNAVREALQHRPSGPSFESILLNDYPTPIAEARARYRELPERENSAKVRHGHLAAQFELVTASFGALAASCYIQDGAFDAQLNQKLLTLLPELHAESWVALLRDVLTAYRQHSREFLLRPLYDLFEAPPWEDSQGLEIIQRLNELITPMLSSPISSTGVLPWDALFTMARYHRELWHNDALLQNRDIAERVNALNAFLYGALERIYRLIDFNLMRVDAIAATSDGIQHDLMTLRGVQPESFAYLAPTSLDARGLYLFNLVGKSVVSLSPFLIASPCSTEHCERMGVAYPVRFDPSAEILYRCSRCGQLRRPGLLVQQSIQHLYRHQIGVIHTPHSILL